jgi:hypothetical protein
MPKSVKKELQMAQIYKDKTKILAANEHEWTRRENFNRR